MLRARGGKQFQGSLQAPQPLVIVATMPSSSLGESGPPPKKAHTKGCLLLSTGYLYVDGLH
jgi:hypothetical protein